MLAAADVRSANHHVHAIVHILIDLGRVDFLLTASRLTYNHGIGVSIGFVAGFVSSKLCKQLGIG
jgi:hypothetical protein